MYINIFTLKWRDGVSIWRPNIDTEGQCLMEVWGWGYEKRGPVSELHEKFISVVEQNHFLISIEKCSKTGLWHSLMADHCSDEKQNVSLLGIHTFWSF
jgi:hypothetical protein